jgi:hypothetical protein
MDKKIGKLLFVFLFIILAAGCSAIEKREELPLADEMYFTYHRVMNEGESMEKRSLHKMGPERWEEKGQLLKIRTSNQKEWKDSETDLSSHFINSTGIIEKDPGIGRKATFQWLPSKYRKIGAVYKDIDDSLLQNRQPTVIETKKWNKWQVWVVQDLTYKDIWFYDTETGWLVGEIVEHQNGNDTYTLIETSVQGL